MATVGKVTQIGAVGIFGALLLLAQGSLSLDRLLELTVPNLYTVVSVYDGDTFTATKNGQEIRVRLMGVDTPEMRGKTNKGRAIEARTVLQGSLGRWVILNRTGVSFGRVIAGVETWPLGVVVNSKMRAAYPSTKYDHLLTKEQQKWLEERGWE